MQIVARLLFSSTLLVFGATGLFAQTVEIAPFYGLRFGGELMDQATGESLDLQESAAFGLALDVAIPSLGEDRRLELLWSHQDTRLTLSTAQPDDLDLVVDVFQIGLTQDFGEGKLVPFLTGTLGATHLHSPDISDVRFTFGLIGGFRYSLLKNLALRADLRGYGTVVDGSGTVISSGGLFFTYSGTMFWQGEVAASVALRF